MKAQRKQRDPRVSVKKTPPTKAEMIASIQQREAALYLEMQQCETTYGADNDLTILHRAAWSSIHQLMQILNITSDLRLPDNQAAIACMHARVEKQRIA